ncbi:MAG: hypothetical protein KDA90_15695 [Planctomycetaceae bacterium]|nr:hypothetical protein [Planctomycetaceae bacterium]
MFPKTSLLVTTLCLGVTLCVSDLTAQGPNAPRGQQGPPVGHGRGRGHGADAQFAQDHETFFYLLEHRNSITRSIRNVKNGVQTITESTDPAVATKIREHVAAMYDRVESGKPIHMRDPLFREVFRNASKIQLESRATERGIEVIETSEDPYVATLIQLHAQVVSQFIKNGHAEVRKNHPVPNRDVQPQVD